MVWIDNSHTKASCVNVPETSQLVSVLDSEMEWERVLMVSSIVEG